MREQTAVAYLVPLRLFTGWVFVISALSKIHAGWLRRPALQRVIEGWLRDDHPYRFYAAILRWPVLAHPGLFTWLVIVGELVVGAALLAGLFTRPICVLGILITLNYLLGRGDNAGANPTSPFIAILVTLLLTHPGRVLGLDAALEGRLPRWLTG
jgi:thiosulfate dehydrogenase [quinone] large subunit